MKTLDQVEPRRPISSAPFVITSPGSYYLTTNLVVSTATNGIVVASGSVTLDLNGFALLGSPASLEGILLSGTITNVAIRNGNVSGWGSSGISDNTTGQKLNVTIGDIRSSGNGGYGITLSGSQNSLIHDCNLQTNQQFGIYCVRGVVNRCTANHNHSVGIYMLYGVISDCNASFNGNEGFFGFDSIIRNCTAEFNAASPRTILQAGIRADEGSLVSGCVANFNGLGTNGCGILSDSSFANTTNVTIENCTVSANQNDGIQALGPASIINNTAFDNGKGVAIGAGIHTLGSGSYIEGNRVRGNRTTGIRSEGGAGADVIIRNTAGNNPTNYFPTTGATFAPIQSPATMTNAWGNISF
jgi:hypothetical protein